LVLSLYCITACIIYVSVLFQPKCEKYWPDEGTEKFGDIEVTLMKIEEFAYHVTHTLQLKKVKKAINVFCFRQTTGRNREEVELKHVTHFLNFLVF
jgi:hypothetical protein